MSAGDNSIDKVQAGRIGDALLAAPAAEQMARRESIERQREMKPRSRAAMMWVAVAAMIGLQS